MKIKTSTRLLLQLIPQTLIRANIIFAFLAFISLNSEGKKVFTIYFCGTGTTAKWVDTNQSGFHSPELIASLYAADESIALFPGDATFADQGSHYKLIVDGIGTHGAFFNKVDPEANLTPPLRRWDECLEEASKTLDNLLQAQNETVDLNLVGFSRGGVLCMLFARYVADQNLARINNVNILAFDPVPGYPLGDPIGHLAKYGSPILPDIVGQYVGIYAQDERSFRFEPLIPAFDSPSSTDKWLFSLPGSHETLVGSRMDNGHSLVAGLPNLPYSLDENLKRVGTTSRIIALQLLSSPDWGRVTFETSFAEELLSIEKSEFCELVNQMNNASDYWLMHSVSFSVGFSIIDPLYFNHPSHIGHVHLPLLSSPIAPTHYRLCYEAPFREEGISDQVFLLDKKVSRLIDGEMAWNKLHLLKGDITPPLPIVDTLPDIVAECAITISTFPYAYDAVDGIITGSTNDPLTYSEQGEYVITWHFSDTNENTASQSQTVIIKDTQAPVPMLSPLPLIHEQCSAIITEYPIAMDNCAGELVGSTDDPLVFDQQGEFSIKWIYDDGNGNTTEQIQQVLIKDTIPPIITLESTDPHILWPANHKYETLRVDQLVASVTDNCSELSIDHIHISKVTSDESDNTTGDGNTINDITLSENCRSVHLRKERQGSGNGRVYTIFLTVSDEAGNGTTVPVNVYVPHDKKNDTVVNDGVQLEITGDCGDILMTDNSNSGTDKRLWLSPNYPNPFKSNTTFQVSYKESGNITITIYNTGLLLVRTLHAGYLPSGKHRFTWDGKDNNGSSVSSGIYLCQLKDDNGNIETIKMAYMK
jgi:hypothetical protein